MNSPMKKILVFGTGGHSKVIVDLIQKSGQYEIAGIIEKDQENIDELPCLAGVIAIGDNWKRGELVKKILKKQPDFKFCSAIHPSAQIGSDVKIGDGTVIMAKAVVNSGSEIGQHCIINTKASVDHDCKLKDFSSIAPGATLGGNVNLGTYSAISLGASVIQGISIGDHSVIGAGSTVVSSIPDHVLAYGVPCKVIRKRELHEKIL